MILCFLPFRVALKLEKVGPIFFKFHPCPSLPSVAVDDRKQFPCLSIFLNNETGPLFPELPLMRKHVFLKKKWLKWLKCLNISTGQLDTEEKSGQWLGATVVTSHSPTNNGKVLVGKPTLSVSFFLACVALTKLG